MKNTKRIETLIGQMSLDEKIAQIGSVWFYELQTNGVFDTKKLKEKLANGIGQITRVAGASTLDPVSAAKTGNFIQKFLMEETRLKIPAILHEECCNGAMILGGTVYPQVIGLASTFQPDLAEKMTKAIRKQLMAIGARQALAPVLDVSRDPRWGRTEETFGEDPTLVAQFGVSYIRGLQGDDLASGVMATGKHFIGHSLSQGGQNCAPVHIGRQELFDIFLVPFQAAIRDAGLASMMNSYPELDGEVVATSRRILTELLRDKLGFTGVVVSDYEAILMIHTFHHAAEEKATAGILALQAGIDVELPTSVCYTNSLKAALSAGDLSMETIDLAVSRHLEKKNELGLFENPYVNEKNVLEVFETPDQRSLALEIARKSMVLLKNDGILPLKKSPGKVVVIGPNADDHRNQLSDYSYAAIVELMKFNPPENSSFLNIDQAVLSSHDVNIGTVLEGIKEVVTPGTSVIYTRGCDNLGTTDNGIAEAINEAKQADVVVLVLGDRSGLIPACTSGETRDSAELRLPGLQEELARAVLATGKPTVVVLITGRPYALPWLDEKANAILEAWIPGEMGGKAVADILFGEVNPSGKLPVTFPRHVGQVPINYNHKPSGMKSNWYIDYVTEKATPLYSFGHGLSYTDFKYDNLSMTKNIAKAGETIDVSFRVTNTGKCAGDEICQLYLCDEFAKIPRPMQELKGFVRVGLVPGESKLVTFHLPVNQLAYADEELNLNLEAGHFLLMIGRSSADIRLRGGLDISDSCKLPLNNRVFKCPVEVQ